jgi:hypothetical protein
MQDPILEGLTKHRASLVAQVRNAEATIQSLLADIEHLDATIRQFNPAHKAPAPAVSPLGAGNHITRTLLTILRKSPEPMTLRALRVSLMETVGLNHRDRRRIKRMMEQVRTALARQLANGTVAKEMGPERALVWRIAG